MIIILDDEDTLVVLWKAVLQMNLTDAKVLGFTDSLSALNEISERSPDLLVMDWQRPHIPGDDMVRLLAQRKANFPVLVASGFATEEMITEARATFQIVSLLRKPFGPAELVQRVERLLAPGLANRGGTPLGNVDGFPARRDRERG